MTTTKSAARIVPYGLLVTMALLVMVSGFFVRASVMALLAWAFLLAVCLGLFARSAIKLRREDDSPGVDKLLAVSFATVFLVGEFGASTESRLSFLVSIWRLLALLFLCVTLRRESRDGYPVLNKLMGSPLAAMFVLVVLSIALTVGIQILFLGNDNIKGVVRCTTYYGALAVSLYCACAFMRDEEFWSTLQTVFRVSLLILVILATMEMLTGFHLPTSWLLSDSPNALLKLEKIGDPALYVTATGPCYNPNNFCLLLATLACLSIPVASESKQRRVLANLLFYITLTIVAMLGSTIVSLGMIAGIVAWFFAVRMRLVVFIGRVLCALLCMLVVADFCLGGIGQLVSNRAQDLNPTITTASANNAETVTGDFSVQLKNYERGGGSMWMRVNLYLEEIVGIIGNPVGLGPGNVQSYFEEHPSVSRLVDPHNWFFEFAMSYGVITALLYAGLLLLLIFSLCKVARAGASDYAVPLVVGVVGAMAGSFAPSSSDFNTLLWIPVVFGIALVTCTEHSSDKCEDRAVWERLNHSTGPNRSEGVCP